MRLRGMAIQGYNAQVVANEQQLILAARVTNDANDQRQLAPMLNAARESLRRAAIAEPITTVLADGGYFNIAPVEAVRKAGIEVLIPPNDPNRSTPRKHPRTGPIARELQALLATPAGQRRYRRRQVIVEPVFARTKHHRGITRFLRRGLHACQAEFSLIATTHNLLKLWGATRAPAPA